jgi:3D (Asp-Asp-Asp) domain-containing protein
LAAVVVALCCASARSAQGETFVATAHSLEGRTASGTTSRPGTVAADPKVLPLGSRIRVQAAGAYSGDYTVVDTGPLVKGRRIDIYMRSNREARRFGRKRVKVQVLERGHPD